MPKKKKDDIEFEVGLDGNIIKNKNNNTNKKSNIEFEVGLDGNITKFDNYDSNSKKQDIHSIIENKILPRYQKRNDNITKSKDVFNDESKDNKIDFDQVRSDYQNRMGLLPKIGNQISFDKRQEQTQHATKPRAYDSSEIVPVKSSNTNKVEKNKNQAEINLLNKEKELEQSKEEYKNKLSNEYKKEGIDFQTKFNSKVDDKISFDKKKEQTEHVIKPKEYDTSKAKNKIIQERKNVEKKLNEVRYAQYQYDKARVESEETTPYDKTIGIVPRAIADITDNLNANGNEYINEDGKREYLPTYNQMKQQKVSSDYKTNLGRFAGDAAYNISKIMGAGAINTVTGGIGGSAMYFTDMFADNYKNVINEGYDTKKALLNSAVSTGLEYITGKVIGSATKGLTGGKTNEFSKAAGNTFNKIIKKPQVSNILGNASSEALEEFTQEYLDNFNRLLTLENSTDLKDYWNVISDKKVFSDALYSAGVGALSGGFINGRQNTEGKQIDRNTQFLTTLKESIQKNKTSINDPVKLNEYDNAIRTIDNYIAKPFTGDYEQVIDNVEPLLPTGKNNNIQIEENPLRNATKTILPIDSNTLKEVQNTTSNTQNDINSINVSNEQQNVPYDSNRYEYIVSDNYKINNLRKSASEYLNSSNTTYDFINVAEKVIRDKGYNIVLDDNLISPNGNQVNAQIRTLEDGEMEIRINPNSERAGEFLLTHEITHAIENQEMINLVMDYASKNQEFDKALRSLKRTYGTEDISSEVLADISGQLFGNQEFISSLSTEKSSIFKKIYDKIISLANKITGNSKEDLFIKDLKNKWEKAYRTQNNRFNNTKYHISSNFSTEIDQVLNGEYDSQNQVKARDYTPQILIDNGIKDLPMLMTSKHIKSTILTKEQAINSNRYSGENTNYHGLGKETLLKVIDSLDNPLEIYKTSNDNYLIITEVKDYSGKNIVVPIKIDGKGTYNNVYIDENQIKSAYGRNNLTRYIESHNFEKIYTKKGNALNEKVQYLDIGTSNNDNISQNDVKIKQNDTLSTKYSIQNENNNAKGQENSSFYFDKNARQYECLSTTKTIEFYKKNSSDIGIVLKDSSGNLVNEIALISKNHAIKQLGSDIANYIYNNVDNKVKVVYISNDIIKNTTKEDYKISHRPSKTGGYAYDIAKNGKLMPNDVYDHPEWYFNMKEKSYQESMNALNKIKDKPNQEITVYRATTGDDINDGDWVTLSKSYAEEHLEKSLDGNGQVISKKVKAKEIQYAGDDINEFGYFPINKQYSKKNNSWQNHIENNYKSSGTKSYFDDMKKDGQVIQQSINEEKNSNKENNKLKNKFKLFSKAIQYQNYSHQEEYKNIVSNYNKETSLETIKKDLEDHFSESRGDYTKETVDYIKSLILKDKILVSESVKDKFSNFSRFKKENASDMKLGDDGKDIIEVYNILSEKYPSVFDKSILTGLENNIDSKSNEFNADQLDILEQNLLIEVNTKLMFL